MRQEEIVTSFAVPGDRRVNTATELGFERAAAIVRKSSSSRIAPVRAIMDHADSTNAIFAQQFEAILAARGT